MRNLAEIVHIRVLILPSFFLLFFVSASAQIDSSLLASIKACDFHAVQTRLKSTNTLDNVDSKGANALFWAAYYCDLPMVKYLVQQGAKVPPTAVTFTPDEALYYSSLTCMAARQGKLLLLEFLADSLKLSLNERETDYNSSSWKREGRSLLSCAAEYGRLGIVKYLLKKAVAIDVVDSDSTSTPLIKAAENERWAIFNLLLQTPANKMRFGDKAAQIIDGVEKLRPAFSTRTAKEVEIKEFTLQLRKFYFGETSIGYACGLNQLAVAHVNNGAYSKAEQLYRQVIDLLNKIYANNHPQYIVSLHGLAFNYYNTARYTEGIALLKEAQKIIKKIYAAEKTASDYSYASDLDGDFAGIPEILPAGYNLTLQGLMYFRLGDYHSAAHYYQKAMYIATNSACAEHQWSVWVLINSALLHSKMGLYKEAIVLYEKARDITKSLSGKGFDEQHAVIVFELADAYSQLGQFDKALPLFEKALPVITQNFGERHQYYAMVIDGIGLIYAQIGEYEKSISLYSQTLNIYKRAFKMDHPYCASALNNLASVYASRGDYNKAISTYVQALNITKKTVTEGHLQYAQSLNNLATLYEIVGRHDSARYLYYQAISFTKKSVGEENNHYANYLANLACLYARLKYNDTAIYLFKEVLRIRQNIFGDENPDNVKVLNSLGWLYSTSKGSIAGADSLMKASYLQLKHLKRNYSTLSEREKMIYTNKLKYEFSYIPSLLFRQKQNNPLLVNQAYRNELALKGIILEDLKQILENSRKTTDSLHFTLFQQWRFNKALIGTQSLWPKAQRAAYFDSLEIATNQLEQQLSRKSSSRSFTVNQNVSATDIGDKLKKGQAAIEFLRFQLYNGKWTDSIIYAAILLLPGDTVGNFIPLFEETQLLRLLGSSPNSNTTNYHIEQLYGDERGTGKLGDSLYELIWQPLEKHLQSVHTVYYAPVGLLHRISFNAIPDGANHFLIDRYQLRRIISTRSIVLPQPVLAKHLSAMTWGDINYNHNDRKDVELTASKLKAPTYNTGNTRSPFDLSNADTRGLRNHEWPPLKAAKQEIDTINYVLQRAGLKVTSYTGSIATEEAFKMLDSKSPQVLHLATHGFFLPVAQARQKVSHDLIAGHAFRVQRNPMFRSGLVLAGGNKTWTGKTALPGHEDGILTAYEIAQLDLSNTELLVLSACETALGDLEGNEGVVGLQRGFKIAGVKQMVLTLWSVYDEPTRELITLFYKNYLSNLPAHEALRNAQMTLKLKYPEPYHWAAFVLIE